MVQPITTEAFDRLALGDARLTSLAWVGDVDVVLGLSLPKAGAPLLWLLCRSVAGLRVSIDFGPLSGPPLVWEATLRPARGEGWHLRLDFAGAPTGAIDLDCLAVELLDGE